MASSFILKLQVADEPSRAGRKDEVSVLIDAVPVVAYVTSESLDKHSRCRGGQWNNNLSLKDCVKARASRRTGCVVIEDCPRVARKV